MNLTASLKGKNKNKNKHHTGEENPRAFFDFERESLWADDGHELNFFLASACEDNTCSPTGTALGRVRSTRGTAYHNKHVEL